MRAMTVIIHIIDQKTGQDHRDNDKDDPAILKETKGNAGIVHEGKMQDIPDDSNRFVQIQETGKEILGQAVKKDNGKNAR